MDSDIAIRAEGLGKKYIIGHQSAERGATLRDTIVRGAGNFARLGKTMLRGQQIVAGDELEEFWALRDLNFEIKRGDVVGVIGRNGAGKSTLLKVLSRITEPTEGRVQINGRVASLLEVGTGFHPELSGRENIYLNGAILGMTRAEIRCKFDEIVAFSEVEKFLDTPVKRYSSGMYVRLAFAVAAHLEPEILIVDEVLAVGDAEFQKKCLGKMQDVAGEGRTVLFVSHNMMAIKRLCTRGILLNNSNMPIYGSVAEVIEQYSNFHGAVQNTLISDRTDRKGNGIARLVSLDIGAAKSGLAVGEECTIRMVFSARPGQSLRGMNGWVLFRSRQGEDVLMVMQRDDAPISLDIANAKVSARFSNPLTPGVYSIACGILKAEEIVDWLDDAASIEVINYFDNGKIFDGRIGQITLKGIWEVNKND